MFSIVVAHEEWVGDVEITWKMNPSDYSMRAIVDGQRLVTGCLTDAELSRLPQRVAVRAVAMATFASVRSRATGALAQELGKEMVKVTS